MHFRWVALPRLLAALALALAGSHLGYAQFAPAPAPAAARPPTPYDRQEVMLPMRDGVQLHTLIFRPRQAAGKLPFLLQRTPYGVSSHRPPEQDETFKELAADGYIFVFQDIRGRYQSEGTFVMLRPARNRRDPQATDEASDTYDTVEWLLHHVPGNNGRAGILGISYDGWLAAIAGSDPHPALKAVSEQATPADMFKNDDYHHNGAFRLSYGFEYAFMTETGKRDTLFQFGTYDTYNWYLKLGPLSNINRQYVHGRLPTWNDFVAHPNYDAFWQRQALPARLDYPRVPTQHVGGWFDQEDMVGPQAAYQALEAHDTRHRNYLVIGPWNHGGWAHGAGSSLGLVQFGSPTAAHFRQQLQAPWFAYYLKGQGSGVFDEATTFQTGSNRWRTYPAWPPPAARPQRLYLRAGGRLAFEAPPATEAQPFASYVSDPARPVPYRLQPIEETYGPYSRWYTWLAEDQRSFTTRPDVLSWQTDTLTRPLTVSGNLLASLCAATTGTDADWVVKVIDVYPDRLQSLQLVASQPARVFGPLAGYQQLVAADVLRARFRTSLSQPQPLVPGQVETYTLDLHALDHVFLPGHRIMVQVQSTWFPLIDRNPQTYVPNIFEAAAADYQPATQRVYQSGQFPSCLVLPVAE